MSNLPAKTSRKVGVYDTKTQKLEKFHTTATTFKELKEDLKKANISLDNCKFTEPISKLSLIEDGAMLPLVDFVLMRTPVSTKSGAKQVKMSLALDTIKQCTEHIKTLIDKYPHAKDHFTGYSKLKIADLQEKIKSFSVTPAKKIKEKVVKTTVVKKEPVKVAKEIVVKKEKVAKETAKKEDEYPSWYTEIVLAAEKAPEVVKLKIHQLLKAEYKGHSGDVFDDEYVKSLL